MITGFINQKYIIPEIDNYLTLIKVSDRIEEGIGRIYSINGKEYPSVTTILNKNKDSSGLDEWRKSIGDSEADKIMKEAAIRGSSFHSLIENHLQGLYIDEEAKGYLLYKQVIPYLKDIIPVAIEIPLYSDRLKVAGRCDLIGVNKKNNQLTIFDWKTSRKIKSKEWIEDYFIQATLYAMMANDCLGLQIKHIQIVIGVDNDMPLRFNEDVKNYLQKAVSRIKYFHKMKLME